MPPNSEIYIGFWYYELSCSYFDMLSLPFSNYFEKYSDYKAVDIIMCIY